MSGELERVPVYRPDKAKHTPRKLIGTSEGEVYVSCTTIEFVPISNLIASLIVTYTKRPGALGQTW